jgi:hypothetical protein
MQIQSSLRRGAGSSTETRSATTRNPAFSAGGYSRVLIPYRGNDFAIFGDETVDPRRDTDSGTEPSSAASVLSKFLLEPRAIGPEKVL